METSSGGSFKCNLDGDAKGNSGPSSRDFRIKNGEGKLIYAEARRLEAGTNLVAEVVALRLRLEYRISNNYILLTLVKNSLTLKKILGGIWEVH